MGEWISWRDEYAVGIRKIDEQHRELFRRFNEMGDALWDGAGREVIDDALKYLANYTVEHFKTEEQEMANRAYPGYDNHRRAQTGLWTRSRH